MWWWTYVYHIKNCNTQEGISVETQLEPSAALPLSFRWSDPAPILSDQFDQWRDSIIGLIGADEFLEVTGLAFRDETSRDNGAEQLSEQRAQAIVRLFMPHVSSSRILQRSQIGTVTQDIKNKSFSAYRLNVRIRNDFIIEMGECTLIYFPFDSTSRSANPVILKYLGELSNRSASFDESFRLLTLVEQGATPSPDFQIAMHRMAILRELMLQSGIPAERAVLSSGNRIPEACRIEDSEMPLNMWIVLTTQN